MSANKPIIPTSIMMLVVLLLGLFMLAGATPAAASTLPAYCQESNPDFDPERCEAEEGAIEGGEEVLEENGDDAGQEQSCEECRELLENTTGTDEEDPQLRWKKLHCMRMCAEAE